MRRRVLGPSLGFRTKEAPAPPPPADPAAPAAKVDQVAEVVSINADDSVTFRVSKFDPETQNRLAEITVVYATSPPPADAAAAWFLGEATAFPRGVLEIPPGFSETGGEPVVVVPGVPYGISFVQVIWGYDDAPAS